MLIGLVLLVLLIAVLAALCNDYITRRRGRALKMQPWEPVEIHRNRMTIVELQRHGCESMPIGDPIDQRLPYYEYEAKVQDLWSEALLVAEGKNERLLKA
jgi:hypothetical protein